MVKLLVSTFSLFVFAALTSSVNAQAPVLQGYPNPKAVPDVNSPQVRQWVSEIDLTGVPNIRLTTGQPPSCTSFVAPASDCSSCNECHNDDLVTCTAPNTWGITFDDGPSPVTPSLLDYLKQQNISATFFVTGDSVIHYPTIAMREHQEGHILASHTWSHHALTTLTNEQIIAEMKWAEKAVMEATGVRMKYMRPPYGDINNRVRFVLRKLGYTVVDWTGNFDTNDWQVTDGLRTPAQVVSAFTTELAAYAAGPKTRGFYSLQHDLVPTSIEIARGIIPLAARYGVKFGSVAVCEGDANPYQAGGALPAANGTATPTRAGATPTRGAAGTSAPIIGAGSGAESMKGMALVSFVVALAVSAFLA